jgi:hypothetical protein
MLKGMPSWVQKMNSVPGTTLVNLFDMAQRGRG